jgi:CheY-like chemotaxis protein
MQHSDEDRGVFARTASPLNLRLDYVGNPTYLMEILCIGPGFICAGLLRAWFLDRNFQLLARRPAMARILIVDDDPSLAHAIRMVLEEGGFDVTVTNCCCLDLDTIERAEVDVILIDVSMPGTDAFETIRSLCRRLPTVPVIAMSGSRYRSAPKSVPAVLALATEPGAAFRLQTPFRAGT